jgi:hypothetical protein
MALPNKLERFQTSALSKAEVYPVVTSYTLSLGPWPFSTMSDSAENPNVAPDKRSSFFDREKKVL